MKIRALRRDDLDAVATLIKASFSERLWPYLIYAQPGIACYLASFLEFPSLSKDRCLLVACEANAIRGFAEFRHGAHGSALLSYICVDAEARGRGIATALIGDFNSRISEATTIELDVFKQNDPAIALYRKLGLEVAGESHWFTRTIAADSDRALPLDARNLPAAVASQERFGFCEVVVSGRGGDIHVGRIGHRVLRLFDRETFRDDALLHGLKAAFPSIDEALFIAAEAPDGPFQIVNTTLRMRGSIEKG